MTIPAERPRDPSIPPGPATADRYRWMAWGGVQALILADGCDTPARDMPRAFNWIAGEDMALDVIRAAVAAGPRNRVVGALDRISAVLRQVAANWPGAT